MAKHALQKVKQILPEITVAGNGIHFKGDSIIIPKALQGLAIALAHRGIHLMQSGIEGHLRVV